MKKTSSTKKINHIYLRIVILVVTFAIISFLLKSPASVKSIIDSAHLNDNILEPFARNHINYLYEWFCVYSRICPTFDKFSSILFAMSISTNIFFYYLLDNNFRFGFNIAVNKLISNSNECHIEYVKALENARNKKAKNKH